MTKTKVVRSVKINAFLNIIKQCSNIIFPLITYPYVFRKLGDVTLGKHSFAYSIAEYGVILAALGISTYVIREGSRIRDKKEEITKFISELFTISLVSMLFSIGSVLALTFTVPKLQNYAVLICILSINIFASIIGRDWINSIYEDYLYISVRYIIIKIISLILILCLVKKPEDLIIYTIITVFSESGGYFMNVFYTRRYVPYRITLKPNFKKHMKPMLWLFGTTVAVRIYIQSDITILGFMRNDSEVGIYTMSSKIYSVIKALLNAVIFVVIPRVSYYLGAGETEKYNVLLNKLRSALITLIFPCIIGVVCLSKNIMLLLGGKSGQSGYISLMILGVALLFAVLGCYYAQGVLVPNRLEKKFFITTSISALVNIILNLVIIPFLGLNGAALTTLISEIIIMLMCRYYAKQHFEIAKNTEIMSVIIGCLSIALICCVTQILIKQIVINTVCSVILSVGAYFAILLLFKNSVAMSGIQTIKQKINKRV